MDFSWTKRSSSPHELFASNNSLQWIQVKVQPHLVSTWQVPIALNQN